MIPVATQITQKQRKTLLIDTLMTHEASFDRSLRDGTRRRRANPLLCDNDQQQNPT